MRRIGGHRDLVQESFTSGVLGSVSRRLQVLVVREQEPVVSVRPDRVPDEKVPHQVRGLLLRDVVGLRRRDRRDPADAHHEPRDGVTERLALLAVKEDQRALRRQPAREQLEDRLLPLSSEHPWARERRLLVGRKRCRKPLVDGVLLAAEHPRERHDERGVGRDLDQRRLEVAVGVVGLLDARVWVDEAPGPLLFVHERPRLGLACWQRVRVECAPSLPRHRVLAGVVALLADSVERHAERVAGWLAANRAVPTGVVPGNTCSQVEHQSLPCVSGGGFLVLVRFAVIASPPRRCPAGRAAPLRRAGSAGGRSRARPGLASWPRHSAGPS